MRLLRSLACLALPVTGLLTACTIARQEDSNNKAAARIRDKEVVLQGADANRASLRAERDRLTADLQRENLTASELLARVQDLERLNAASLADTQRKLDEKATRAKALSDASAQVRAVQQDPASTPTAKAKRLDTVRQQLRKTLELIADT